jgi:hypothetical protein
LIFFTKMLEHVKLLSLTGAVGSFRQQYVSSFRQLRPWICVHMKNLWAVWLSGLLPEQPSLRIALVGLALRHKTCRLPVTDATGSSEPVPCAQK